MQPLITTEELARRLGEPKLRIYDCSTYLAPKTGGGFNIETGAKGYSETGHIPGAVLIDQQGELSDNAEKLRFTALPAKKLGAAFAAKGVSDDTDVVLYAAGDAWWATRAWWLLRSIGFDKAAVLDGGLKKWMAEGRPLAKDATSYPNGHLTIHARPGLLADKNDVMHALESDSAVVLNCLREEQHKGAGPVSYGRPGHIKGSINIPAAGLYRVDGTLKPVDELRSMFEAKGCTAGKRIVTYCGGGIAATGDAFVLTALLGYKDVTVYDASLQEWAADPALPMAVG